MSRLFVPLFILFLFNGQLNGHCQDFVVTTKGDTLKGKVKLLMTSFEKKVQVINETKQKTTLSILQTKTVQVDKDRFDPVRFNNTYTFMKLQKGGYLSLYGFQLEKQNSFDGQYLLKMDGKGIEVPNLGFKKIMASFLTDCNVISEAVTAADYGRNDLDKLIDDFNACISKKSTYPSSTTSTITVLPKVNESKLEMWTALESKVQASSLETKAESLEMIGEIKSKISKGEKLPKFLTEGLKSNLESDALLSSELTKALSTIE